MTETTKRRDGMLFRTTHGAPFEISEYTLPHEPAPRADANEPTQARLDRLHKMLDEIAVRVEQLIERERQDAARRWWDENIHDPSTTPLSVLRQRELDRFARRIQNSSSLRRRLLEDA